MLASKTKETIMNVAKQEGEISKRRFFLLKIFKQIKNMKYLFLDVLINSSSQVLMMGLSAYMISVLCLSKGKRNFIPWKVIIPEFLKEIKVRLVKYLSLIKKQ